MPRMPGGHRLRAALPLLTVLAGGCTRFTEYSGPPGAGILFLDPVTLEVLGGLDAPDGARALCPGHQGEFFVAATTGRLGVFDALTMTPDTSFLIGPGASAGYGSMAYFPQTRFLYVIGATGNILELDTRTRTVTDAFSAGSSPGVLLASRNHPHLFVTDPPGNRVHRVHTEGNTVQVSWILQHTPTALGSTSRGTDTLLIATTDPGGTAYIQPSDFVSPWRKVALETAFHMVSTREPDLILCAHSRFGAPQGAVSAVEAFTPAFRVAFTLGVSGNPVRLAVMEKGSLLFVLAAGDPGSCTLYRYGLEHTAPVHHRVDLPGHPVDMILSGDRLVILTY